MKASRIVFENLKYLTFIIVGFLALFFIIYPQVTRCLFISLSNYEKIGDNTYVSKGASLGEKDSLKILLSLSRKRISEFWGNKKSNPVVIYCHTDKLYEKYGSESESPANIFGTPIGSYIVIGPKGLNIDVVSHEASHAELSERLGWLTMELSVPTWFNEGLALMVDYRFSNPDNQFRHEDYKKEWYRTTGFGAVKVSLNDISSVKGFFSGNSEEVYLSYLTSGMEVSRWLDRVGKKGLLDFIDEMNNGAGFGSAYLSVQRKKRNFERYRYQFAEPFYQIKNPH